MYSAGARQQAGVLCPIYEPSYMKICNSDTRLLVINPECQQSETYTNMDVENVLEKFLFHGEDACILAYGQTGSGKTHTVRANS